MRQLAVSFYSLHARTYLWTALAAAARQRRAAQRAAHEIRRDAALRGHGAGGPRTGGAPRRHLVGRRAVASLRPRPVCEVCERAVRRVSGATSGPGAVK